MSKLAELPALPQVLSPQRVIVVRIGKVMLGNQPPSPPTLSGLIVKVSIWSSLFLSLSLALPLLLSSVPPPPLSPSSLSWCISSKGQRESSAHQSHISLLGRRRLPSSMYFYSHHGVRREHVELCTGSKSFHQEVTHIPYAHSSLAKPSHMAIAISEGDGEI